MGNPEAMFYMGNCYELGKGVKHNEKTALKWYKQAALAGNEHACTRCQELADAGNTQAKIF